MKKALSLILALTLCAGIGIPALADESGVCGDHLTWTLSDDGTLTIRGTGDMYDYDPIEVWYGTIAPWDHGREAARYQKIVVEDGVTGLGYRAFQMGGLLASVYIPASVTSIRDRAFRGCPVLTDVFYGGTEEQWNAIDIESQTNQDLLEATLHYNSTMPAAATPPAPENTETPRVMRSRQNVTVDGKAVSPDIYNIGGNNYFKLRDVAALLAETDAKFNVVYDKGSNTIFVTRGEAYTRQAGDLVLGEDKSGTAVASSQAVEIDGAAASFSAYNIGGSNYFKLRDLGDTLGFGVDFNKETNTAIITSK